MANPTYATVNNRTFNGQERIPNNQKHYTGGLWDRENNTPQERLLTLTELEQLYVKVIRKSPGSDSKTVSGIIANVTRNQALQQLKKLADLKKVLKCKEGKKPTSGARATLYFYLADDISAELVDAILESANSNPSVEHPVEPDSHNTTDRQASIVSAFLSLPPRMREIAVAIHDSGEDGITPPELANSTGQKIVRIYERAPLLVDQGWATQQPVPGYKNRHCYVPTQALKEAIEWLSQQQVDATSASNGDNNSEARSSKAAKPPQTEGQFADRVEIWEVIEALIDRIAELERELGVVKREVRKSSSDKVRAFVHARKLQR